ncbi:PREDICTED: protein SCAI isoform X2 [Nelumbo nucifera]|uniref:Protein SCAI isoform X2 n=1 Tax=Nelumbo nucifera TaxID=4432 RepID=A0A1U7Z166_NELNU|nr:PREDICTED: protein SCAI isoform X2 [Nelumbo nucifera]
MAQSNIPVSEAYWFLVDKADKKFSRVRDLPCYGRNRYDTYFNKVFKVYTELWKFQQEHRQKLVEAGLRRWEIGEIASRIAQLYYGHYLRTSEASYLSEAYIFYEAILSREYFKDGSLQELNSANKQLRCIARFLIVCLILNRREMVHRLVNQLKMSVDDYKRNFQDADFKEWKQVVQEIVRFLRADTAFMNIRPLRYSLVIDTPPDSLPHVASLEGKRNLKLRDAILSSYHHNEVKFTELTLDVFRMLQCLEWEPSGSFYQTSGTLASGNATSIGQNGGSGPNRMNYLQDIRDQSLEPNPRKAILYHPSVTHFLAVLATICEDLPPDGILLIYLSSSGKGVRTFSLPSTSNATTNSYDMGTSNEMASDAQSTSLPGSPCDAQAFSPCQNKENHENSNAGFLRMGTRGNGGLNCLYPCDLIPFTRRPLFFIVDSDSSQAFKAIHEADKGEPAAILLSPSTLSPSAATIVDSSRHPSGSQFTMFLTAPLQAFCLLLGFSGTNIEMDVYYKAEKLLASSLNDWGSTLATSDTLHPVWAQILSDPFLRRLLLRK